MAPVPPCVNFGCWARKQQPAGQLRRAAAFLGVGLGLAVGVLSLQPLQFGCNEAIHDANHAFAGQRVDHAQVSDRGLPESSGLGVCCGVGHVCAHCV